jgi:hypothetical protein
VHANGVRHHGEPAGCAAGRARPREVALHGSAGLRGQHRQRRRNEQSRAGSAKIRRDVDQLLRDPQCHGRTVDEVRGGRVGGIVLRADQLEFDDRAARISGGSGLQLRRVGRKRIAAGRSRHQQRQRDRLRRSGGIFLRTRRKPGKIDDSDATLPAGNRGHDRSPVAGVRRGRAGQLDRRSGSLPDVARANRQRLRVPGGTSARGAGRFLGVEQPFSARVRGNASRPVGQPLAHAEGPHADSSPESAAHVSRHRLQYLVADIGFGRTDR